MTRGMRSVDPLPDIPQELASITMSGFLYGLGLGPRLTEDPYAAAKVANMDRLLCAKMPVLCSGPGGLLAIEEGHA